MFCERQCPELSFIIVIQQRFLFHTSHFCVVVFDTITQDSGSFLHLLFPLQQNAVSCVRRNGELTIMMHVSVMHVHMMHVSVLQMTLT